MQEKGSMAGGERGKKLPKASGDCEPLNLELSKNSPSQILISRTQLRCEFFMFFYSAISFITLCGRSPFDKSWSCGTAQ